jgi:hypothetical protein
MFFFDLGLVRAVGIIAGAEDGFRGGPGKGTVDKGEYFFRRIFFSPAPFLTPAPFLMTPF